MLVKIKFIHLLNAHTVWAISTTGDQVSCIIFYSHNNLRGIYLTDEKCWSFEMLTEVAQVYGQKESEPEAPGFMLQLAFEEQATVLVTFFLAFFLIPSVTQMKSFAHCLFSGTFFFQAQGHQLRYILVVQSLSCSTPGFRVFHCLPEFAQAHVHWVDDAIQLSHPLSPTSPALNLSQDQWVSSAYQLAKVLELQHQSFQWIFRVDFLQDWLVWFDVIAWSDVTGTLCFTICFPHWDGKKWCASPQCLL